MNTSTHTHRAQHHSSHIAESHDERWSPANIQECVRVWNLTEEQREQLQSLGHALRDTDHYKNTPHELTRYLKGPKGLDHAESMFRACIDWRKSTCVEADDIGVTNVDDFLDTYQPPQSFYDHAPSALLLGTDHENDPIYVERAGDMDGYGFCQRYPQDTLLKDVVWRRELTAHGAWQTDYVAKYGHLPRQITVIYDLHGLSSRHCKKGVGAFFKDAVAYTQDKYYGVSKRMIIIRAPAVFKMVWRVAKNFFRPEVREKMIFATGDHLECLAKYMDLNVLPPCIYPHGQGETARGFPPQLDGGLIPDDVDVDAVVDLTPPSQRLQPLKDDDTAQTYRSRDSGSFSSYDSDASSVVRVSVLVKGSLMLSECGTTYHLDKASLRTGS